MKDHLDQRQIRVTKLETLRGKGINPYPYSFQNSHTLPELLEIGRILVESQEEVSISGRLMALRGKGKAVSLARLRRPTESSNAKGSGAARGKQEEQPAAAAAALLATPRRFSFMHFA